MNLIRRNLLAAAIGLSLAFSAQAKDPKEIVIGTSAGPYGDQLKIGIKPILEKQGFSIRQLP